MTGEPNVQVNIQTRAESAGASIGAALGRLVGEGLAQVLQAHATPRRKSQELAQEAHDVAAQVGDGAHEVASQVAEKTQEAAHGLGEKTQRKGKVMQQPPQGERSTPLMLRAATARDLMVSDPVSIRDQATVKEALLFLTNKGFSAAPVIDQAGHPVGVVSQTNLVAHTRQQPVDDTPVRAVMTPAVFAVVPETPASKVIEQMLALQVHRLFVVDQTGVLVGVISAFDVLRHLR